MNNEYSPANLSWIHEYIHEYSVALLHWELCLLTSTFTVHTVAIASILRGWRWIIFMIMSMNWAIHHSWWIVNSQLAISHEWWIVSCRSLMNNEYNAQRDFKSIHHDTTLFIDCPGFTPIASVLQIWRLLKSRPWSLQKMFWENTAERVELLTILTRSGRFWLLRLWSVLTVRGTFWPAAAFCRRPHLNTEKIPVLSAPRPTPGCPLSKFPVCTP